jgi:hypothetical protein
MHQLSSGGTYLVNDFPSSFSYTGCGNGKYLDINPSIYKIGIDRCSNLTGAAREKNFEVSSREREIEIE